MIDIKTTHQVNFLYHLEETTVEQLYGFIERQIPLKVQKEAVTNGMWITGPVYWNYFGFTGEPAKPFLLEIAVPVAELKPDYKGSFKQRRSETFKCVTAIHEGDWMKIPETYEKMFGFMDANSLTPTGNNRELYLNADFKHAGANITQIQIGIK